MGARFAAGSPEQLFHALHRKHSTSVDRLLAENGVSDIGQPMILIFLAQQENGVIRSQRELAEKLRVSPATVTISLKSMERDGYVKRLSNAEDQRCKPLAITEKGRQAARLIDSVFETLDRGMYRGFSPEELTQIASFYQRIIDNMEAVGAAEQV